LRSSPIGGPDGASSCPHASGRRRADARLRRKLISQRPIFFLQSRPWGD